MEPYCKGIERLLCISQAVPLGVALSIRTGIPLVYSQGSNQPGVFDLVGAYDVGHPAALVVNSWQSDEIVLNLIDKAQRVGLEIEIVLAIVNLHGYEPADQLTVISLFNLTDVVGQLVEDKRLPMGQAQAVQRWLSLRQHINHHRD
jgi:hypothetical protein